MRASWRGWLAGSLCVVGHASPSLCILLFVLGGCGRFGYPYVSANDFDASVRDGSNGSFDGSNETPDGSDANQVPLDGSRLDAAADGSTDPPVVVPVSLALNATSNDRSPSATGDLLELFYRSNRAGGLSGGEIWRATRSDTAMSWDNPTLVTELSHAAVDRGPEISRDGLTLYFSTDRGGVGFMQLYQATRTGPGQPFADVRAVTGLETIEATHPTVTADGELLIFASSSIAGSQRVDLYESRSNGDGSWGPPTRLDALASDIHETSPCISPDGLVIYFYRDDPALSQDADIFRAARPSRSLPFGEPTRVDSISGPVADLEPWFSADEGYLLFVSDRDGQNDLYEVSR